MQLQVEWRPLSELSLEQLKWHADNNQPLTVWVPEFSNAVSAVPVMDDDSGVLQYFSMTDRAGQAYYLPLDKQPTHYLLGLIGPTQKLDAVPPPPQPDLDSRGERQHNFFCRISYWQEVERDGDRYIVSASKTGDKWTHVTVSPLSSYSSYGEQRYERAEAEYKLGGLVHLLGQAYDAGKYNKLREIQHMLGISTR